MSELISQDGWTVRLDGTTNPKTMLLMLHGWGGDQDSMWIFARRLPKSTLVVSPRAPYAVPTGGYSWMPIAAANSDGPTLEHLRSVIRELLRVVDATSTRFGLPARRFTLMGFSQGAALAATLMFVHPERVEKCVILAGFVPKGLEKWGSGLPLSGKRVLVVHGRDDRLVDIGRARHSSELFEQAGAIVSFCEDDVGHRVSAACFKSLEEFLRA